MILLPFEQRRMTGSGLLVSRPRFAAYQLACVLQIYLITRAANHKERFLSNALAHDRWVTQNLGFEYIQLANAAQHLGSGWRWAVRVQIGYLSACVRPASRFDNVAISEQGNETCVGVGL
jgi:hypothetical protein